MGSTTLTITTKGNWHPVEVEVRVNDAEGAGVLTGEPWNDTTDPEAFMDTSEKEDLTKGNLPLVDHFSKSCTLTTLRECISESYSKELLSRRLQGVQLKEGIVLKLFMKLK